MKRPPAATSTGASSGPSDQQPSVEEQPRPRRAEVLAAEPASLLQLGASWLIDGVALVSLIRLATLEVAPRVVWLGELDAQGDLPVRQTAVLALAVLVSYGACGSLLWGRSLGRLICGTRLIDREGHTPGLFRSLFRSAVSLLSFVGGFVFAVFDARGQTLHDKLAGTRVVRAD